MVDTIFTRDNLMNLPKINYDKEKNRTSREYQNGSLINQRLKSLNTNEFDFEEVSKEPIFIDSSTP